MPPPAAPLRLAQVLCWRVRFAAEDGDAVAARAALLRMAHLRRMYAHEWLLISSLVLFRIDELRLQAIARFLDAGPATAEDRAAFRRELAALVQAAEGDRQRGRRHLQVPPGADARYPARMAQGRRGAHPLRHAATLGEGK